MTNRAAPRDEALLPGLAANIEAAHEELHALCKGKFRQGGKDFRMTIPVRDTDSDVVIGRGLSAGNDLLALAASQAARIRELEEANRVISGEGFPPSTGGERVRMLLARIAALEAAQRVPSADAWDMLEDVVGAYVSDRAPANGGDSPRIIVLAAITGLRQAQERAAAALREGT